MMSTPDVPITDPWLRLEQCAARVQVHSATLRREIARGRLRCARVGGRKSIRVRASWLDTWLESSSTPIEVKR
jgi:excisionase family DNA binding protein